MNRQETFRRNEWPTLGVEIELQLIDARTMELRSAIADVLEGIPEGLHNSVKTEFMQCYVEINTDVCRTVDEVGNDLAAKLSGVEAAADRCGVGLGWGATHPFSRWQDQQITPNERYYRLAELMQETVTRPVTFGLHVHVGVDSGDKAVRVMDRLQRYLPILLAVSSNSPFWHGRLTGHHAHRVEVLEGFPSGGLPPRLESWEEYLRLVGKLKKAGCIESHRELWWDVRPNAENGTVEVRICDMPPDLHAVQSLTSLIQCLVHRLSNDVDSGRFEPDFHPMIVRQNRWRAYRFGLGAELVDPITLDAVPARKSIERLVRRLRGDAADLGCERHLESLLDLIARPNGSERQIALFEETGDLAEVVRILSEESRSVLADRGRDHPFETDALHGVAGRHVGAVAQIA